jgi:SAM-dependent methyltransferase
VAGVNLWTDAQHSARYLATADDIPMRGQGEAALLEHVPAGAARVLDLGTGDGRLVALLKSRRPDLTAVGVDFSPTMLAAARTRFDGDATVSVVEHDLDTPLDPAWGTFDAVVSCFAIHHVDDTRKRALFGEVFARLRPGGVFCNLEHVASPTRSLHAEFLAALSAEEDPSNKLAAVEAQLAWLREAGFDDVDCHWKWRELALLAGVRPS